MEMILQLVGKNISRLYLVDFAPVVAETAGFIFGEGDDGPVFGRCEVVGLHDGFLLAFLLGIELTKGREGLEVRGLNETEVVGLLPIAVVHQHPFFFADTLPYVGSFTGCGFRVDERFLIGPWPGDVVGVGLLDAGCSLVADVGEIVAVAHLDDVAVDGGHSFLGMLDEYLRSGGQRGVALVDVGIVELVLPALMAHGEIQHQLAGFVVVGCFRSPCTSYLGINLVHVKQSMLPMDKVATLH